MRQPVTRLLRHIAARLTRSAPGTWARRPVVALTSFVVTHDDRPSDPSVVVTAKLGTLTLGRTVVSRMWRRAGIELLFSGGTWVHPLARGVGVGTLLLRRAVAASGSRWPREQIFGNISHANLASLRAYEKAGFVPVQMPSLAEAIAREHERRGHDVPRQVIVRVESGP